MAVTVRVELVSVEQLKEHEQTDPKTLQAMVKTIRAEGVVRKPIAVDSRTYTVLDGAHRLNALKLLRCDRVPACVLDYQSDDVVVYSSSGPVTKEDVIGAAKAGRKFPPKTTRHMVRLADGRLKHISWLEKDGCFEISALGGRARQRNSAR